MAKGRVLLTVTLCAGLLVGAGYVAIRTGVGPLPDPQSCEASVAGHSVGLTIEQAENASIIAAVAERRELPARAITIALAAALQESKLENLRGGDRDSVGLFQQRPSQGWGHRSQILNPWYAAGAFYDALVKVDGYQTMSITKAAQAVQRSAYPDAYAAHEADARALASALSGYSKAAFSCQVESGRSSGQAVQSNGLTLDATRVREAVREAYGRLHALGYLPRTRAGGRSSGRMRGRAINYLLRPVDETSTRRGWALAAYLVANADRLHIAHIVVDGKVWSADHSSGGWRDDTASSAGGTTSNDRREPHDSVHVDVW